MGLTKEDRLEKMARQEGWWCHCLDDGEPLPLMDAYRIYAANPKRNKIQMHVPCDEHDAHAYPDIVKAEQAWSEKCRNRKRK